MNKLYKKLIFGGDVSLSVLDTTNLVNDAISIHSLNASSAKTLGGLLTCAAFMAGCLKSDRGSISITVRAGGDAGTACVSGDSKLNVRGYIDSDCDGKLNGGYLTVIKDDGFSRPFVGACELVGNDVSDNLMNYFHVSEQIETAVAIDVKIADGKCVAAGGVIMQLMPGCSEEHMDQAENQMQAFIKVADVLERLGADGIMREYFGESESYEYFPEYRCSCSRKKIEKVIIPLGKKELYDIIEERGVVRVHCHYCNKDYDFTREEVDELL